MSEASESLLRPQPVLSVQYLRGVAAMMVVLHHARNPKPWLYNLLVSYGGGANGVDLFFVISGFVMYTAARNELPAQFALRRAIRIAPMYWAFTAISTVIWYIHSGVQPDADMAMKSALFIPYFDQSGHIWPILIPGWTLNYEVFFYGIFFLGLLAKRPVATASTILLILAAVGFQVQFRSAVGQTYTSPRMLEFAAGLASGALFRRGHLNHVYVLLPFAFLALMAGNQDSLPFVLTVGVPAVGVVISALAAETRGFVPQWQFMKSIGDASYSIYLTHLMVIDTLGAVWKRLPLSGEVQFASYIAGCFIFSSLLGLFVHRWFEKPVTSFLQKRGRRARAVSIN